MKQYGRNRRRRRALARLEKRWDGVKDIPQYAWVEMKSLKKSLGLGE